ncbi:MAG: ATP-dependent DNA helicase [Ruminococcus sp.]|nr:ATP-dependent DNA helicase [Ruminococcus sp.]
MMHLIKYPLDETVKRFFEEAAAKGFEMREGQMEMANEICTAITEKRPLAVEAEVGIGKSFAYLVPALIQFFRERRQVVIATSTIALQEQLYHDAQTVLKMLGVHANIILAKGMKNYACMKRVHSLYSRHKNDIYYGRLWQMVRNGQQDKAEITMNISDTEWDKINISNFGKDRCKSCPYTRSCQYHKMRSSLVYESAIVICNQNMLVSHLMNQQKGKGLFSPSVNTFIIDEAHNIESKFRSAYTTAYSKSDIVYIISESVKNIRNPILKSNAEEIIMELEELFRMFRIQVQKQESESEGDANSFFLEMNKDIKNKLIMIRRKLASLNAITERDAGPVLQFLREATNGLKENIVWLEKEKSLRLCVCQKDIRRDISKLLFSHGRCTILTSATISDKETGTPREKCSYYLNSIGYPVIGMVSEPKKSPFDYDNHTMLYCSAALPYPSIERRKQYREASIPEIVKLLEVTNGKTLILFTAKEDMEYVYKKLSNMQLPYKILMQSKTSSQAYQLDKFKADTNSVILGTGTYWEGINVEGESLSQVIIYKLPFPVPEPIIDYKMSLTENPIDEVAVPEMVIQLKQGVGRLIRSASDTGIVSIMDPRVSLRKAKYADVALDALSVKNRADSIEELHTFWDKITSERSQKL